MKKTFIFGLIAAALGFTACSSEDDLMVNNQNNHKGMVLRASVEQPAESRATFTDNEGVWQFAFDNGDKVSVTNTAISTYYTFTNDGTEFASEEAKTTASDVTWSAYFPSNNISLIGQSGTKEDVANYYVLEGKTASATTGKGGLNITLSPKVAILVINNQKGAIDINVKITSYSWVKGFSVKNGDLALDEKYTKQTLLSATEKGTYYIAVPAGKKLAVKDGDDVVKSTGTSGLQAGKYYNLTIPPFAQGEAAAKGIGNVRWIQLWADGPKFAEYNVGATSITEYGGYYCWGKTNDKDTNGAYKDGTDVLTGTDDTATNLWGSKWRMPTKAELQALLDNCDVAWTDDYKGDNTNIKGRIFTGRGDYSSNSVFLPASGNCGYSGVSNQGDRGLYWSSTPSGSDYAYLQCFTSSYQFVYSDFRYNGLSVRAVLAE